MDAIKLTNNELSVLQAIAINEYNVCNYGTPESAQDTTTYIWTLDEGIYELKEGMNLPKGKSLSGTISSLTKKGLVRSFTDCPYEDQTIGLTDEGFELWKEETKDM